ncbi:hypothetical protein [Chroococcus sp. FPU101]|uniref:hypothetical protein n=1 Tax=Chroococcus sp. FPU101 TaxID=1974212 RepID=UPI001A8F9A1C|nr:hypothetical protein [Chroococcus sp. FPU101]
MTLLQLSWLMAQTQFQQAAAPLINRAEERLVYVGVVLLAIAIAVVLGLLSRRLDIAILISLALSAFLIVVLLMI